MIRSVCSTTLLLLLTAGSTARAADVSAMMANCNDCHGNDGVSQWTAIPTIAGIAEFVHADALFTYRDNARPCADVPYQQGDTGRPATSMCAVAAKLSDEEIESLAAAYAQLPWVSAKQDFDAGLVPTGKALHDQHCDRCHSDAGMNPDDEAGMLGGQWSGYLATSMAEFASRERPQPEKMEEKIALLSDEDVQALLSYYASQQ